MRAGVELVTVAQNVLDIIWCRRCAAMEYCQRVPLPLKRGGDEPSDEAVSAEEKEEHGKVRSSQEIGWSATGFSGRRRRGLLPLSGRANQPVGHQTKPEIHHDSQVHMKWAVAGHRRQRRRDRKVDNVAQHYRQERL